MSFYGDPYGFGGGYGPPSYYPAYPAQYYSSGNTIYHHRRKPPKEKDNAQVWCDICDVGCIGQQSYIEHCGGRKHQLLERKKAQLSSSQERPQETEQPPNTTSSSTAGPNIRFNPYDGGKEGATKGPGGKFYCELCKIYSNDQSTFQLHLVGKKHKINKQRLQPAASDPYGPALTPIPPMSVIHPPRYHIPSSPRSHFTPTLTNTPTNVEDDLLLTSKLESLTPSTADTLSLRHLVEAVTAKLDEFSEKHQQPTQPALGNMPTVVETKLVGPYAWGTLMKVNLTADIVVITRDHPTFGTLQFMQQTLTTSFPDAQIETGKDTMEMHIRMPQGTVVHLLFTWVGAWEERAEGDIYHDMEYQKSPISPSPPMSPSSPSPSLSPPPSYPPQPPPHTAKSWTPPYHPPTSTSTLTTTTPSTTTTSTSSPSLLSTHEEEGSSTPTNITIPSPHTHPPTQPYLPSITAPFLPPPMTTPFLPPTQTHIEPSPIPHAPHDRPLPATAADSIDTQEDINILASQKALLMIRQAMWFSHNSLSPNVRQCIKIMKDLRHRNVAFAAVNNWALEVMVVNALRTLPLSASISQSLRAIFAFIASGTLLPGVDLLDPCVQYGSVLQDLSQEDRLAITKAAQKILNDIAFGRWEVIVG